MERKFILGLAGVATLTIGVFAPIVRLPVVGSLNYFRNGKGDGVVILVLALASLVITLWKNYKWLLLTGMFSVAVIVFTLINLQQRIADVKAKMESDLSNNPFRGIADIAIQSVQLEWGWVMMLIGAGLLILSAVLPESAVDGDEGSRKCPFCAESIKSEAMLCKHCGKEVPSEEEMLPEFTTCPACGEEIELDGRERMNKRYVCDVCNRLIDLNSREIAIGNKSGAQSVF